MTLLTYTHIAFSSSVNLGYTGEVVWGYGVGYGVGVTICWVAAVGLIMFVGYVVVPCSIIGF